MRVPSIKIGVHPRDYDGLRTLGLTIIINMTSNSNFPSPSPALEVLASAADTLGYAITQWGTQGHRGSQGDLLNLRVAARSMRNLLVQEAAYISNLVDPNTTPEEQAAFIVSSGFAVRGSGRPQGKLEQPMAPRLVHAAHVSPYEPMFIWNKPQGLNSPRNVPMYEVYRGTDPNFYNMKLIGRSTRTSFQDMNPMRGVTNYYCIVAINSAGMGLPSTALLVPVPN